MLKSHSIILNAMVETLIQNERNGEGYKRNSFLCELQNELNFYRNAKKEEEEINESHIFDHSSTPITTECFI